MDLYLKFDSEEQATEYLFDVSGEEKKSKFLNVDFIGAINIPTGEFEEVGEQLIPKFDTLEGYHVNVRLMPDEDASSVEQFMVQPEQPYRVWAGPIDTPITE